MAAAPTLGTVAAEFYDAQLPLAWDDENQDWSLAVFCAAIGGILQELDDIVRDTDAGPGWSALVDIDRAPMKALPWLGQTVGVQVDTDRDDAGQRSQIRDEAGMRRGRPASMIAAAQQTLTGTKTVIFEERYGGDAYYLRVVTYTDETPDSAATHAALLSQKPAALFLEYLIQDGQTWRQLRDTHDDWQDVKDSYDDWRGARSDEPA